MTSSFANLGSHWFFCSTVACLLIAVTASEPCTETAVGILESPASNSSITTPYYTASSPEQP